jgi:hypothetical protein
MPSIYVVDKSDVETFTVVTNPIRTYVSSSTQGSTGSVHVFPRHSLIQKDIQPDSSFIESAHDDSDLSSLLRQVQIVGRNLRNTSGHTLAQGNFTGVFDNGLLVGVYYPNPGDPAEKPSSSTLVFPTLVVTGGVNVLVSGSTVMPGTGIYPISGAFQFLNAQLAANFPAMIGQYLNGCAAQPQAARLKEILDPIRFSPPPDFNSNTLRKLIIKEQLNSFYLTTYPTAHWAYTNYNALNFFTSSMVPSDSVIMYPNIDGGDGGLVFHENYCSGTYTPSGSFSFDFHINPRYTTDGPNGSYKAGAILHLSSTFCLSLVTGSSKDVNGRPVGFRLQLQLSRSAEISPSWVAYDIPGNVTVHEPSGTILPSSSSNLIFLSDDNALWLNHWHHVVVRWGTVYTNLGVGTFNVDGADVGTFTVPSRVITPSLADIHSSGVGGITPPDLPFGTTQEEPTVLCVGNFYEGSNNTANPQAGFFALDPATRDGLNVMWPIASIEAPTSYSFNHPLNAEIHDLAIRRCYMSDLDILTSASVGPTFLDNTFALYVPPFFTNQSPFRQFVNDHGGILVTPFEEVNGTTTQPFSVALSFGVAGHYINLENFVKDLGSENFPMLHHLTGVAIQTSTDAETCNDFLYSQPFVAKRNLTILPCDDGLFVPSFQLLVSESLTTAVDDLGVDELSFIHLDNMVMSSTLLFGAGAFDDGSQPAAQVNHFANTQIGATPETPFAPAGPALRKFINTVSSGSDVEAGAPLTVFQRTQDPSSNEIVIFDISNLFYGFRISPGTLSFNDPDLLKSSMVGADALLLTSSFAGPIGITLADDGRGNIYRADCLTSQSTWNSVGNVYYDEGLVVMKSPHVFFFGANQYSMLLRGEQHVHVMKIDAIAPNNQLNSSSNPAYLPVPPTGYPNDPEDKFVYVTNLNFHDRDLNVVMKTSLAQPIQKRTGDRIMFKVKLDL